MSVRLIFRSAKWLVLIMNRYVCIERVFNTVIIISFSRFCGKPLFSYKNHYVMAMKTMLVCWGWVEDQLREGSG